MPRHLHIALDHVAQWPRLPGNDIYYYIDLEGHVLYPPGGREVCEYLHSISVWQLFGFELTVAQREDIRELWKHRPDLRYVLGEAIGYYVCPEFLRAFQRSFEHGGRGDVARWIALAPELRPILLEYLRAETRRFNQPFAVIRACSILTRELDEPPEIWRAAALAIHRDDRRQARRAPDHRNDFLRHDLETHGTLVPKEGALINRMIEELGGEPLDIMEFGAWWHPTPVPHGRILARIARASRALAGERWSSEDTLTYARALAAVPESVRGSFDADEPFLEQIVELAAAT